MSGSEIRRIGVFCGSHVGDKPSYAKAATELVDAMSSAGITLVYGGATVGIMGILANRMLSNNGHVIGVIHQALVDVEIAHPNLTELRIVNSMHERKAVIADLADGFIMLPGGTGTLDEFFEITTWAQLGYHNKPCGILNVDGYFDLILKFLDHAVASGFLKEAYRNMIIVAQSPQEIIQKFKAYQPPVKKWPDKTTIKI